MEKFIAARFERLYWRFNKEYEFFTVKHFTSPICSLTSKQLQYHVHNFTLCFKECETLQLQCIHYYFWSTSICGSLIFGAIVYIMQESSMKEVLYLIYSLNSLGKMLTSHAYTSAVRAHFTNNNIKIICYKKYWHFILFNSNMARNCYAAFYPVSHFHLLWLLNFKASQW